MSLTTLSFPEKFNLADYFLYDRLEEGLGDKKAILFGDRSWTYSEVANRTTALQHWMKSFGINKEQRVLIILPDSPAFAWSIFATLSHGAVVAMGNPDCTKDDLSYLIEYSRAAAVITIPRVAELIRDELQASDSLKGLLLVPEVASFDDPEGKCELSDSLKSSCTEVARLADIVNQPASSRIISNTSRDDVAFWLFTSGSTGKPKAAVHSHRDFAFNTEAYAKATVGYQRDDITVSIPRLYFGYATGTNLLFPFSVGATAGLFSEYPSPETLTQFVEHYSATIVTNVPTMIGKILEFEGNLDLSSVRFHLSAGEALPETLMTRFSERFGQDIYDGIGSAEMFHIYCTNRPGDIKPGSLGKVVDGYEIKILDKDAQGPGAKELAPGETGVMWVKGDSVAHGYFQQRDKSWETFHGHWCRTGDLFRLDEQGYLYFSGRADDVFKVSGLWLAPLEIEECLLKHPAIAACCLIPVSIDGLTKSKAVIVLRDAFKGDALNGDVLKAEQLTSEIQQHVKDHLSHYKYPRQVEFVDELPKNDRGKVDRKSLIASNNDC